LGPERQPRINLLAYRQEEAELQRKSQRTIIIAVLITVVLVAAAASIWWNQNQQVKALEEQNQQLEKQVEELSQVAALAGGISDQEVKELGSRKALLAKLEEERTFDPQQLKDIYALGVPDITIGKMAIKTNGEITINAYTGSQAKLIKFLEKLQQEDFVKEIQRLSSKRNDKTGEISFTLVITGEVGGQ
jgi:Tfp pilus assembly protein PilN